MGSLADLAVRNSDQLMSAATPALRAALERHLNQSGEPNNGPFNSFIGAAK
ncbi:hypothetical protein ACFXO9_30845 [Nocardia tengchongensis]|uniref:hypothetical protein n=1 Tax=Nocardia tengchongensis TaxID=2055889 RepID=UPI003687C39C